MQKIEEASDITLEEAKEILLKEAQEDIEHNVAKNAELLKRNLKKKLKIMPKILLLKQYKDLLQKLLAKKLFMQYQFLMKK